MNRPNIDSEEEEEQEENYTVSLRTLLISFCISSMLISLVFLCFYQNYNNSIDVFDKNYIFEFKLNDPGLAENIEIIYKKKCRNEKTTGEDYSSVVQLYTHDNFGIDVQFCGGTLIENNSILTAAHCMNKKNGFYL
jgi:V8-like Glu-specific endopeptidase